jgi:hypothetical protein
MTAGHSRFKASFHTVFTAEYECGDGLQMKEHIFWDCKLYEDKGATMMNILSESRGKEYPKSVTELLRLEEKRFLQGACCFINTVPKSILKKEINIQKY